MANFQNRSTRSKLALDLAAINDAVKYLEVGSPCKTQRRRHTMDSVAPHSTIATAVSYQSNENKKFNTGIEERIEEEGEGEADVDPRTERYGSKLVTFLVGPTGKEMKLHRGVLSSFIRFRFSSDLTNPTFEAQLIDVNIFTQVREWLYRGSRVSLQIAENIFATSIHKSRSGIHVLIKYYILAHKLDCAWLQDILIDFILSGYWEIGSNPDLREIGFVFTRTAEDCCLRDYMTLATQYILLATNSEEKPANQDVFTLLRKVPQLHFELIHHSRGIMNYEQGILRLPRLEEHLACDFHAHGDNVKCHARDKEIKQLSWFSESKRASSIYPIPFTAVPTGVVDATEKEELARSRASNDKRASSRVSSELRPMSEVYPRPDPTRSTSRASFAVRPISHASSRPDPGHCTSRASTPLSGAIRPISQVSTVYPNSVPVPIPSRSASRASTTFYLEMAAAARGSGATSRASHSHRNTWRTGSSTYYRE